MTIGRCVRSALAQTHGNIEIIVVDDGSCDGTAQVLEQFGKQIVVLQQKNSGPSLARNLGASMAHGEILAFLDSDDEWLPEKIERQVDMMQAHGPSLPCCICNAAYSDGSSFSPRTSFSLASLRLPYENAILENPISVLMNTFLLFNQAAAIRRESFEHVGGFDASLRLLEDYELSLRLATLGPWGLLREPLVIKHEDTVGIGVTAMKDELSHLDAKEIVFKCILSKPMLQQPSIQGPIAAELRLVRRHQGIHRWMLKVPLTLRLGGRVVLFIDRIRKAVARRMPSAARPRMRQA
ncbi:glycosyl transferase [Cyanobium sp. Copco_Reservoir_LC18]|nr:glycosyl transferase [Cyanobium sp. Copco_Reservoir_LC18]